MAEVRCERCKAWAIEDPDGLPICCNARCSESWQAAREAFEGSLLGRAVATSLKGSYPTEEKA